MSFCISQKTHFEKLESKKDPEESKKWNKTQISTNGKSKIFHFLFRFFSLFVFLALLCRNDIKPVIFLSKVLYIT